MASRLLWLSRMPRVLPLVPILVLLAACTDDPGPSGPQVTSRVERHQYPVMQSMQLDLLFVIDSSPSMAAHHTRLDAALPGIMTALQALPTGLPDLHLGVVTADLGGAGCATAGDDGAMGMYLTDEPVGIGERARNYQGTLADAFSAYARVGTAGCATQKPLAAMRRALENPANAGFRRSDAYLAIVIVTANDDASEGTLADYVTFAKTQSTDPTKVTVTTVSGAATGSTCGEVAAPRLADFVAQFPNRNSHVSICSSDLTEAVALLGQLVKTTLGVACWESQLVDTNPATPELEPECAATLTSPTLPSVDRVLESCDVADPGAPCWRFKPEPAACPTGPRLSVAVDHLIELPRAEIWVTIECSVIVDPEAP